MNLWLAPKYPVNLKKDSGVEKENEMDDIKAFLDAWSGKQRLPNCDFHNTGPKHRQHFVSKVWF